MNYDFTLTKYKELCQAIINSKYEPLTVKNYLSHGGEKVIILRHDVDREPKKALMMAQVEKNFGISATYYFRMTDEVYKPKIIEKIVELGHEVGYHYEVLDKTNGDFNKAIQMFEEELMQLQKFYEIKTICMHGNPLSKWLNRDIWKKYDFKHYGIIGEPYLSIDYKKVFYITDTGRKWNSKSSVKDYVDVNQSWPFTNLKNTTNVINFINEGNTEQICILTHPNRWNDNFNEWLKELILQNIKNVGKMGILWWKKFQKQ